MVRSDQNGVVLITIDSLRRNAVFGSDGETNAPNIAELAATGIRFDDAIAHGNWTPFSFPGILGSRPVFDESNRPRLPDGPTLASWLSEHGVTTAGFNAGNGFLTEYWGYDRGFDEFEPFVPDPVGPVGSVLAAHPTVQGWVQLGKSRLRRRTRGATDGPSLDTSKLRQVEERARSFLETVDGPFFLWVHYMDPHTPYVPAAEHRRAVGRGSLTATRMLRAHLRVGLGTAVNERTLSALRRLYTAAVHQTDASIGRLLDTIGREGLAEDTCVVLAGDHGEEFLEHGHLAHYPKLYDELVAVPLVVSHPDVQSARVRPPVGLASIPPTVCDALGLPPAPTFEETSLLQRVRRGPEPPTDPVPSVAVRGDTVTQQPIPRHLDDGELLVASRTADWTYIRHTDSGQEELYDRRRPGPETTNLIDNPPSAAPLDGLVEAASTRADRLGGRSDDETVPEDVETRLAALGYR